MLFPAVTAEEKGLLGSEYYATHPLYPLEKTVAVINMDGMAPFGPSRDFGIYGAARFELLDQLKDVAKGWDIRYTPDPKPEAGLFFRSDHFPFAKRGVPALSWSAGRTGWTVAWLRARRPRKTTPPSATTSRATNGSRTGCSPVPPATGSAVHAGQPAGQLRAWPNWSKDESFRAVRDASADQRE